MSDTTHRALRLLGLLQARPVWTGPELAERLGVTVRSVRRDVARLRQLGYPVAGASEAAVRTLAKLDAVMPARLRAEVRALRDSIATLAMPGPLVDGDLLLTVARACRDTVRVGFGYTAHDAFRTFRLDRVTDLAAGTWRFTPRPHEDPASWVQRSVVASPYRHTARVRIGVAADADVEVLSPPELAATMRTLGETLLRAATGSAQ